MLRVEIVSPEEFAKCLALRIRVFVEEQKVPREEEEDGLDPDCIHFLACEEEVPLGTARLRFLPDGSAKAERVAVLADHRRAGVGAALMDALEVHAREKGAATVRLNAQVSAIPFYERIGYEAHGPEFDDAGIPHRAMTKG